MIEHFADIDAVWVMSIPIALALVYLFGERRRRAIIFELLGQKLAPVMVVQRRPGARFWKYSLRTLAAVLIGVAIMRPQWGTTEVDISRRGIDIVFAVDVSKSMLAEDVQPNRLERVKQDIRYFYDQVVKEDRVALVAFAGSARVLCPLTLDRSAFDIFLDELEIGVIPVGGTNLEACLDECLAAFADDERNHKAIVLFSDGEDHEGLPEDALKECRQRGVRLYAVGIGSEDGVTIPVLDASGSKTLLKDENGDIVQTRLNDRILKEIAQATPDGAYTHLSSGRQNLATIYAYNIKKIEERELSSKKRIRGVDRYQWFLAVALLALMIEPLINDGVRSKQWRTA